MTRKTKGIIVLSLICAAVVAITISVVLIVINANANPFEGTWVSADKRGSYTFYQDGSMKTFIPGDKLPVLETAYNGSLDGTYAYDKSEKEISITLSVYSKEITSRYTYEIEENTLILTNTENKETEKYNLIVAQE